MALFGHITWWWALEAHFVEMKAALLQPCVCRPTSRLRSSRNFQNQAQHLATATHGHQVVVCSAMPSIKRVIDHHCNGHITWWWALTAPLVEMKAALLQPCVCRLLIKSKFRPLSTANLTATHGHEVVLIVVPAYIKRVIDHHCLATLHGDEHSQHTCRDEGCTFTAMCLQASCLRSSRNSEFKSQLHSNTWPSSGVVVPAYIKRVIDHHCLGT